MELLLSQLFGPLLIVMILLGIGFFCGRYMERKHYASIIARETAADQVMIFAQRFPPTDLPPSDSRLVTGSVVISSDYFKRFIAGLRMLIGGRLNSYESLLDRARREAILRMRAQATSFGATHVFCLRLETLSITGRNRNSLAAVEVLAYGTAIIPKP